MINSKMAIEELHKAFDLLNKEFYEGKLPEPYIVIHQTANKNALGWFTPHKVWTDKEGEIEKHEIAISAEYLNNCFFKVIETLHHEMIHLYCHTNGIKDTSRQGRYHNKKFKEECLKRGFYYKDETPDKTHGWTFASITDKTKEVIESWNLNTDAFKLARAMPKKVNKPKKKSPTVSYECPECDAKVRGKRELNIMCGDCEKKMEAAE